MILIAQGGLVVFLFAMVLFAGIALIGLVALSLTFTKNRHHWTTLACALPAFVLGLWMTVTHGLPGPDSILVAYILTWLNLLFGGLAVARWWHGRRQ